jgi:hypothetical protein
MINGKFMITLIAVLAVLIAVFNGGLGEHITENYIHGSAYCAEKLGSATQFAPWGSAGQQFTSVGVTAIASGNKPICTSNTKLGYQTSQCGASEFPLGISTKRNMTSTVSPRFNNTGATPFVRQVPPSANVAANNSLKPVDVFSESTHAPITTNRVENFTTYDNAQVPLPQDMCNVNIMGTESQPVVYDRLMYSNMRSRLRGLGDYIRGDIKITPDNYKSGCQHNNWFQVSVKPERDLNPGAMEQLFGRSEELNLSVAQGDLCIPTYGI